MYVAVAQGNDYLQAGLSAQRSAQETLTIAAMGKDGFPCCWREKALRRTRKAIAAGISPVRKSSARSASYPRPRPSNNSSTAGSKKHGWRRTQIRCARHHRPGHPAGIPESSVDRDPPGGPAQPVREGQERGAPATAVHVRDIVKRLFSFAAQHGDKGAKSRRTKSARRRSRRSYQDRAHPLEIRVMHRVLETTATLPTIRLALRLILLTLVRKSELIEPHGMKSTLRTRSGRSPRSRMKGGKPHNVYLSQQALDIMVVRTCAGGSLPVAIAV